MTYLPHLSSVHSSFVVQSFTFHFFFPSMHMQYFFSVLYFFVFFFLLLFCVLALPLSSRLTLSFYIFHFLIHSHFTQCLPPCLRLPSLVVSFQFSASYHSHPYSFPFNPFTSHSFTFSFLPSLTFCLQSIHPPDLSSLIFIDLFLSQSVNNRRREIVSLYRLNVSK